VMWFLFVAFLLSAGMGWTEVSVSNLSVAQRAGSKCVDVFYEVDGVGVDSAWVSLRVRDGAEEIDALTVAGDVGLVSRLNSKKRMVWDLSRDWNGAVSTSVVFSVRVSQEEPPPAGMVVIPAGVNEGFDPDFRAYSLTNEATLYADRCEVSGALWQRVYDWGLANGYEFKSRGASSGANHPVHSVSWYDCLKWCNARSEMLRRKPCYLVKGRVYKKGRSSATLDPSANGFRLPTGVEWEYMARGGRAGSRFPWGNTLSHELGNYTSDDYLVYDVSKTSGIHPSVADGDEPFTTECGAFPPNGMGLCDSVGNVWEWCADASRFSRMIRGGCWSRNATYARLGNVYWDSPKTRDETIGFRTVFRNPSIGSHAAWQQDEAFCFFEPVRQVVSGSVHLDSRDYVLRVVSEKGVSTPAAGVHVYPWRSRVACSVEPRVVDRGVLWETQGWTGRGSVPLSGRGRDADVVFLTNVQSSIEWIQTTDFGITLSAAQREGTKKVDVSYRLKSKLTAPVQVALSVLEEGSPVSKPSWSGDTTGTVSPSAIHRLVWDAGSDWSARTGMVEVVLSVNEFEKRVSVPVDTQDYMLTVLSGHGSPSPKNGKHFYPWRSTVACKVGMISGRHRCSGWIWTDGNDVPEKGSSNLIERKLTSPKGSVLIWMWIKDSPIGMDHGF